MVLKHAWDRRRSRWGDYGERVALAVALVFIFFGFQAIQHSRKETVRRACLESNARHDNTIKVLDDLIAGKPAKIDGKVFQLPPGEARVQAAASRTFTVLLIDQLSPKTDCSARAKRLTK